MVVAVVAVVVVVVVVAVLMCLEGAAWRYQAIPKRSEAF